MSFAIVQYSKNIYRKKKTISNIYTVFGVKIEEYIIQYNVQLTFIYDSKSHYINEEISYASRVKQHN